MDKTTEDAAREQAEALRAQAAERFGEVTQANDMMLRDLQALLAIKLSAQTALKDGLTETYMNGRQRATREKKQFAQLLKVETQITKMLRAMGLIGARSARGEESDETDGPLEY